MKPSGPSKARLQMQSAAVRTKHAGVVGDTLFALGCGRMFEGNAQQMWTSLSKMKPLPPNTKVFCAHEYTQSNAKFAVSVDPDNQALQKRAALINDLRNKVRLYIYCQNLSFSITCQSNLSVKLHLQTGLHCAGHSHHSQYVARGARYQPIPTSK